MVAKFSVGVPREDPSAITTQEFDGSVGGRFGRVERRPHHLKGFDVLKLFASSSLSMAQLASYL
ncbi:hypothetical protein HanXRQr2_Chr12g0564101 [Helianthus annuus]|uniref:Uncharacterized protein n=1 Tax=Helianthus annuus TaxID=4232 RepID=A0A9K3HKA8_HELAN|nr:hypothetical protein HanXRQr2_Chr12g0564101 [Helianthus annuus]KAJ0864567.1 hypothetical protein HanPSC8_Chr12g0543441 [Helianthus annuus]